MQLPNPQKKEMYRFVLEFLQEEHLKAGDALVTTLLDKRGKVRRKVVYKKTVDEYYPTDKDFLIGFLQCLPVHK